MSETYEVGVTTYVDSNTSHTLSIGDWYPWTTPNTTIYTYPSTIYMYQLKCPKCRKMNWGQLDQVITCTQCRSSLKAVSKKVDYEIPIE